jgi:hypothetical protein
MYSTGEAALQVLRCPEKFKSPPSVCKEWDMNTSLMLDKMCSGPEFAFNFKHFYQFNGV